MEALWIGVAALIALGAFGVLVRGVGKPRHGRDALSTTSEGGGVDLGFGGHGAGCDAASGAMGGADCGGGGDGGGGGH
jgi:hypothetical protein